MVIWITGLPGAGKTTIATSLYQRIINQELQVVLLDGDQMRTALQCQKYDKDSRLEISRTYSRLSKMFSQQGQIVICATVSMFHEIRQWNRESIENYFEIYVKVPPNVLFQRDQKGLYSTGIKGSGINLYGFDINFEEPNSPDLVINNDQAIELECVIDLICEKAFSGEQVLN